MYARTWHGGTPIECKEAFEKYEYDTGVKDTLKIEGNCGAYLKVIEKDAYAHFFSMYILGWYGKYEKVCWRRTGNSGRLSGR